MMKNCKNCFHYSCQEIGDNDFGGIYEEYETCSLNHDSNENDELIKDFDRDVERECCNLDFFRVIESDKLLNHFFHLEVMNNSKCDKTYELFERLYQ